MPKNIQISFRLNKYQLAHGLEILKALEPSYKPASLTSMVKLIVQDWIGKMSAATKPWPSLESQEEISKIMMQTAEGRRIMRQDTSQQDLNSIDADVKQMQSQSRPVKPTVPAFMNETMVEVRTRQEKENMQREKERELEISEKSIVTDFSPPTMEELNLGEADEKESY